MEGEQTLGGGSEGEWLRAFNDPELRGIRVVDDYQIEVEPWAGEYAHYRSVKSGGIDGGIVRTKGEPASMRKMLDEHGDWLRHAAALLDVPLPWIAGMAGIEAVPGHGMRWDSLSYRYEPRIDDFSAGIMQTLSQTANGERRKRFQGGMAKFRTLGKLEPFDPEHALFGPDGVLCGVGYMLTMIERYGMHPTMICGGFNAGAAKRVSTTHRGWNEFGIKCYGNTRPIKMFAWINDFVAVLKERGLI